MHIKKKGRHKSKSKTKTPSTLTLDERQVGEQTEAQKIPQNSLKRIYNKTVKRENMQTIENFNASQIGSKSKDI